MRPCGSWKSRTHRRDRPGAHQIGARRNESAENSSWYQTSKLSTSSGKGTKPKEAGRNSRKGLEIMRCDVNMTNLNEKPGWSIQQLGDWQEVLKNITAA